MPANSRARSGLRIEVTKAAVVCSSLSRPARRKPIAIETITKHGHEGEGQEIVAHEGDEQVAQGYLEQQNRDKGDEEAAANQHPQQQIAPAPDQLEGAFR